MHKFALKEHKKLVKYMQKILKEVFIKVHILLYKEPISEDFRDFP